MPSDAYTIMILREYLDKYSLHLLSFVSYYWVQVQVARRNPANLPWMHARVLTVPAYAGSPSTPSVTYENWNQKGMFYDHSLACKK